MAASSEDEAPTLRVSSGVVRVELDGSPRGAPRGAPAEPGSPASTATDVKSPFAGITIPGRVDILDFDAEDALAETEVETRRGNMRLDIPRTLSGALARAPSSRDVHDDYADEGARTQVFVAPREATDPSAAETQAVPAAAETQAVPAAAETQVVPVAAETQVVPVKEASADDSLVLPLGPIDDTDAPLGNERTALMASAPLDSLIGKLAADPTVSAPGLHDVGRARSPRYGLLVGIVAVASLVIPVLLYLVIHHGSEEVAPAEPSTVAVEVRARDATVRGKFDRKAPAAAPVPAVTPSVTASSSAQKAPPHPAFGKR